MVKKTKVKFKDGSIKTQIRVVEGVRDGDKIIHRHIKGFGYLEDHEDQEAFLAMVKEFDETINIPKRFNWNWTPKNRGLMMTTIRFTTLAIDLLALFMMPRFKSFFAGIPFKGKYDLNEIFKFLVIHRLLNPDSKRATFQRRYDFYDFPTDFELHDIYRALSYFNRYSDSLQVHLNEKVKSLIGRDLDKTFYDTTKLSFRN
jgi:hypothetical protein